MRWPTNVTPPLETRSTLCYDVQKHKVKTINAGLGRDCAATERSMGFNYSLIAKYPVTVSSLLKRPADKCIPCYLTLTTCGSTFTIHMIKRSTHNDYP